MERIWHKSYARGVSLKLNFDSTSLPEALSRSAIRFPDNPALYFQGTTVTFKDLDSMVSRFASALTSKGLVKGTRVGIILPNLIQTVVGIYGILRAGGIVVPLNPRSDDMQLEHQLKLAGVEMVICLDVLVPRILELRKKTSVRLVVSCHIRDYLPFMKRHLFPIFKRELHLKTPESAGVLEFTHMLESADDFFRSSKPDLDTAAFILFTSATTGKSKGVELSHGNVSKNVQQLHAWFPTFRDGQEVVVGCVPYFHVFGLTCALNIALYYGYANVVVPIPESKAILDAITDYGATFVPALPSMYTGMLNDPHFRKADLKSLKGCFSGGAPLPLEVLREFEQFTGAQICEGYGLTESSPATHVNPFGGKTKIGTIGLPLPETDAKLVHVMNADQEIDEKGMPGELCIRGPQIMAQYVNNPEKTAETLRDGWLLTGDIAVMDEEGYFRIVDRKKDIIAAEGMLVYPRDIDEILFQHPKVLEACAIGVPSHTGSEQVKAFVVLKKGMNSTPDEIIDYCRTRLSENMVPTHVEFLESLPKTAVGKILRKELRRLHLIHSSSQRSRFN